MAHPSFYGISLGAINQVGGHMSVTNAKIADLYTEAKKAKTIKDLKSVLMDTLKGLDLAFTAMKDMEERLKFQESFHPQLKTTADFKEFLEEVNSAYLNISDETYQAITFTQEGTQRYVSIDKEYYLDEVRNKRMQTLIKILKANAFQAGYYSATKLDNNNQGYLHVGVKRSNS